jgi:cysteinyl-tRNA synthetase
MAAIFDMVHAGNKAMTAAAISGEEALAVVLLWKELDTVLGILELPEEEVSSEVKDLLEARSAARTEKNWAESDRIRDALAALGWTVKDTPEGPKLRKL